MPRLGETSTKPSLIVYHRQERQRRRQATQREKGEGGGIFCIIKNGERAENERLRAQRGIYIMNFYVVVRV
jgi:hypothetical protein